MAFAVLADDGFRFLVSQVLDSLLGVEVKFHPCALAFGVDERERVAAVSVHVAIGVGDASVAHGDGNLVQGFRQQGPEIPIVARTSHVGARVTLHGMVEVGEFQRVAQEEHRSVVAHEVPVALFGVELDGKAADVAFGISRAAFACDGRKANEEFRLFTDFGEDGSFGVFCNVVCHRKRAECTRTFGVHAAFRDDFSVEVCQFFKKPYVL